MLRRKEWKHFMAGLIGVFVGALIVYAAVARTPQALNWPVVQIAKKVDPSVVVVLNSQRQGTRLKVRGIGSGVILNRQGDIVTNDHVVADASRLTVVLASGRRYRAALVGTDRLTDLAVIHIRAGNLRPIVFASSKTIEPGELVVAIGNALGLSHTVTTGIISAKDRVMFHDGWEYHLIQTDAAINPGNSGGALVNAQGELIGLNSSKIAQAGVEGIGFAIPSDTVKDVSQQLIAYGHVRRPWLGATVQSAGPRSFGLLVVGVVPSGPAARAGIRPGDFIVAANGIAVHQTRDMVRVFQEAGVGHEVRLEVMRGSQRLNLAVTLGDLPTGSRPASRAG